MKWWVQSKTFATFQKSSYGPKRDTMCKSYTQLFIRWISKRSIYESAHSFEKWPKSLAWQHEVVSSIQNGRYIPKKHLWAQNGHRVQNLRSILRTPTIQAFQICKYSFFRKMAAIPHTSQRSGEFNPKQLQHFLKVLMDPKRTPCAKVTLNSSYADNPSVPNMQVLILSKNGRNPSYDKTKLFVQYKTVAAFPESTYGTKTYTVCKSYAQLFARRQSKRSKYASVHSFERWSKSILRHGKVVSSIQNGCYIPKKYLWAQNGHHV